MLQRAADAQQKSLEVQKQMSAEQAREISLLTDIKNLLDDHHKERDRKSSGPRRCLVIWTRLIAYTVAKEFTMERERHRRKSMQNTSKFSAFSSLSLSNIPNRRSRIPQSRDHFSAKCISRSREPMGAVYATTTAFATRIGLAGDTRQITADTK